MIIKLIILNYTYKDDQMPNGEFQKIIVLVIQIDKFEYFDEFRIKIQKHNLNFIWMKKNFKFFFEY